MHIKKNIQGQARPFPRPANCHEVGKGMLERYCFRQNISCWLLSIVEESHRSKQINDDR